MAPIVVLSFLKFSVSTVHGRNRNLSHTACTHTHTLHALTLHTHTQTHMVYKESETVPREMQYSVELPGNERVKGIRPEKGVGGEGEKEGVENGRGGIPQTV